MLQLTPGGKIKANRRLAHLSKSGPGNAEGLFECGRKFVDRRRDFAGLFGESGHHPFGYRWFVPD